MRIVLIHQGGYQVVPAPLAAPADVPLLVRRSSTPVMTPGMTIFIAPPAAHQSPRPIRQVFMSQASDLVMVRFTDRHIRRHYHVEPPETPPCPLVWSEKHLGYDANGLDPEQFVAQLSQWLFARPDGLRWQIIMPSARPPALVWSS